MTGLQWDMFYYNYSWMKGGRRVEDITILNILNKLFPEPSRDYYYIRYDICGEISWKIEER
jgi:hypothetical protein